MVAQYLVVGTMLLPVHRRADPAGNREQRREAARLAKRGVCWCKTDDNGRMVRTACPSHHDKDTAING